MVDELLGKIGLVTGAGSGIGRACAILLAQAGCKIALADIVEKGALETVNLIGETGGEAVFIKTDVTQANQVERLVSQIVDRYGHLDWAVNNAGIFGRPAPLVEQEPADFDHVIGINLKSVFLCMKYEIAVMLKQGSGSIVNVGSVQGLVASPGGGLYTASKHGVVGLTKSAALDNARTGIRINVVCPGSIDTPLARNYYTEVGLSLPSESEENLRIPMWRAGKPEEVAQAVKWLCSPVSSYVTGIALPVDGAITAQ